MQLKKSDSTKTHKESCQCPERKAKARRNKKELYVRSIAKTVSYRIITTLATIGIVYALTGKLALSLGVGALEVLTKIIFYYLHERIWNKISWGKSRHPLDYLPVDEELLPEHKELIRKKLKDLGYL